MIYLCMPYTHTFTFVLLSILCFTKAVAQNEAKKITTDVDSFLVYLGKDLGRAHFFIKRAYTKSLAMKKDSLIARTSYNLSYYYFLKNNDDSTHYYLNKGFVYAKKSKYNQIIAITYDLKGTLAANENEFEKALQYYLKALDISERYNLPNNKSIVLRDLGNLYVRQKDSLKAMECHSKSIENAQQHNLTSELIAGYNNLAILYAGTNKKKAEHYYLQTLALARKINNRYIEYYAHINLSDLYVRYQNNEALQKVYYHLQQAKKTQEILQDEGLLFLVNFNFGGYYKRKLNYPIAIDYYKKALATRTKNTPTNQLLNLYFSLSETYAKNKDYKNALLIKEKQSQLSDSIFIIEKNKIFQETQTKYEVEKKNLSIKLLTKEKIIETRKNQLLLVIALTIVVFLIILLLLYRQRIKTQKILAENQHKIHQQEIIRLENEKELKRITGVLEGQEQEKNRLAKEIHDGIGGTLAGIKMQLSQENKGLRNNNIQTIVGQIGEAFQELRIISHNLSSNFIENKSLEELINQLKYGYEKRKEFEVEIVVFPENALHSLSMSLKSNLYRIIQELFSNVSKHAKANQIMISFTQHEEVLNIMFEDNGQGFEVVNSNGIGFSNIKERVTNLGGQITIESTIGTGTTIIIELPTS
jgi:two-component system, NarL family, sensor kinase